MFIINLFYTIMSGELRKCAECGWTGFEDKIAFCHNCKSIYHKCPKCGGSMKIERSFAVSNVRNGG